MQNKKITQIHINNINEIYYTKFLKPLECKQTEKILIHIANILKQDQIVKLNNLEVPKNTMIIFHHIYEYHIIEKNPFDLVRRPKMEKVVINPFSLEEIKKLIKHSDSWFKNYLIIAFFKGIFQRKI